MSSFVTLQLTQKLDAYGIWTARVYWTIGPRVCAAEGGTVRYVAVCTCKNRGRLCAWPHATRAAARLHAAPPAVAPGLRLRAKKRGGAPSVDVTPTVRLQNSPSIETARHGWGWSGLAQAATCVIYWHCLCVLPALNDCTVTKHLRLKSRLICRPPLCECGEGCFANAIRHPPLRTSGNVDILVKGSS